MAQNENITSPLRHAFKFIFDFGESRPGRNAWVDYAKGIAIIFVVYRHVIFGLLYSGATVSTFMMDANEMLYGFRMPLFFFLSGLFYAGSVQKRGEKNYMIAKTNTMLYPYLLWGMIQLTLQIIFSDYTNAKFTIVNYLDLAIHPRRMLQLWYLFSLFNVSMLYLLTDRVLKFSPYLQIAMGLAFLWLKPLVGDISTLSDVMIYYIYFCLGHLTAPLFFKESVKEMLTSPWKLLLLTPVFIVVQYFSMIYADMNIFLYSVLAVFGGIMVIMLSMILAQKGWLKFLSTIGSYSLYIYLIHIGIIFLVRTMLSATGIVTNIPLVTFILMASGIFFSMVVYRACLLLHMKFLFVGPLKESTGERGRREIKSTSLT